MSGAPITEIQRAIAVRKGQTVLLEKINKAIEGFVGQEEYRRIYVKWYGKPEPYWTPRRLSMAGGAALALMMAVMFAWRYVTVMRLNKKLTLEIGGRRRAEGEISRLNEGLERRVIERTEQLEEANRKLQTEVAERMRAEESVKGHTKKLEIANKELEEFAYAASHDLQEPLRTISSYSKFLVEDVGKDLSARAKEDIHFITNAATRLMAMIQNLLALSRAGRTDLHINSVSLDTVMENICRDLTERLRETGGKVEWSGLPEIMADADSIQRLIQNLIGNALKFHGDAPPLVAVRAGRVEGMWEIAVEDNGVGIEKEYLVQIFQPFKRAHSTAKYEGSGIGLSICKKIVERHGGTIWAESMPGRGSRFIFTIPAAAQA